MNVKDLGDEVNSKAQSDILGTEVVDKVGIRWRESQGQMGDRIAADSKAKRLYYGIVAPREQRTNWRGCVEEVGDVITA